MNWALWTLVVLLPILARIGTSSEEQVINSDGGNSTEHFNLTDASHPQPLANVSITNDETQLGDVNVTVAEELPINSTPQSVITNENVSKDNLANSLDSDSATSEYNDTLLIPNQKLHQNTTSAHEIPFDEAKSFSNSTLELFTVDMSNGSVEDTISTSTFWKSTTQSTPTTISNFQEQESTLPQILPVNTITNDGDLQPKKTAAVIIPTISTITSRAEVANITEPISVSTKENVHEITPTMRPLTAEPILENPTRNTATVSTLPATEHNSETTMASRNSVISTSTATTEVIPVSQVMTTTTTTAAAAADKTTTPGSILTTLITAITTTFLDTTTLPSTSSSVEVEKVKNFDELSELEFFNTATVILDVPSSMSWYENDYEKFRTAVACLLNSYSDHFQVTYYQHFNKQDVVVVFPSPRIAEKKLIVCFFVRNSTRTGAVASRHLLINSLRNFSDKFEVWVGVNVSDFYAGIKLVPLLWPTAENLTSNVFERNYLLLLIVSAVTSTCVLSLLFGIIYVRCCRTSTSSHSDAEGQYENSPHATNIDKVCLTNGDRKSTISNTEDEGWVFPYEQFLSMNREDHTDNTRL